MKQIGINIMQLKQTRQINHSANILQQPVMVKNSLKTKKTQANLDRKP